MHKIVCYVDGCDRSMSARLCDVMFFFFKQKTAYEMRISDWSSDVCSSDLGRVDDRALFRSLDHTVTLRAEERVGNDQHHFFELPLPDSFWDGGRRTREEIGRASCRERVCQYV